MQNKYVAFVALLVTLFLLNGIRTSAAGTTRYVNPNGTCGGSSPCYTTLNAALTAAASGDTIIIQVNINQSLVSATAATDITIKGATPSVTMTGVNITSGTPTNWTFQDLTLTSSFSTNSASGTLTINNLHTTAIRIVPPSQDLNATLTITGNTLLSSSSEISIIGAVGKTIGGTINISNNTGVNGINILTKVAATGSADLNANITLDHNTFITAINMGIDTNGPAGRGNVNGAITATYNTGTGGLVAGDGPFIGVTVNGLSADVRGDINGPIFFDHNTAFKLAVITTDSQQGNITNTISCTNNDAERIELGFNGTVSKNVTVNNNYIHFQGSTQGSGISVDSFTIAATSTITIGNNTTNAGSISGIIVRAHTNAFGVIPSISGAVNVQGNQADYVILEAQGTGSITQPFQINYNALVYGGPSGLHRYLTIKAHNGSIAGGAISGNVVDLVTLDSASGLTGALTVSGNTVKNLYSVPNTGATGTGIQTITGNNLGASFTSANNQAVYITKINTEMHFNRILGYLVAGGATVNAQNNWWGCNGGPGTACQPTVNGGTFQPSLVLSTGAQCVTPRSVKVSFDVLRNSSSQTPSGNVTPGQASVTSSNGTVTNPAPLMVNGTGWTTIIAAVGTAVNATLTLDRQTVNLSPTTCTAVSETVGIFRPSIATFLLRNSNTSGPADIAAQFGTSTDLPVVGDWNGDGIVTIGFYRSSTGEFFLRDTNSPGSADHYLVLGSAGDTPIAGDWDGDGIDGVGVFRPSNGLIYLKNNLTTGFADFTMVLGTPGDVGMAGDWNGDGKDSPGVYRPSLPMFFLTDQICNCGVVADYSVTLGIAGDVPFAGDWNGDGITGIGVFRPTNGLTFLRNDPTTSGAADITIVYGSPNDKPVAGHWTLGGAPSPVNQLSPTPTPELAPTFVPRK
jgi:hypothetical protein